MTLRIGVLGAATITPAALTRPATEVPEVSVHAIAGRDPARAKAFAQKHGIGKVHGSYAALLDDPEIDAIYNPLPNSHHGLWSVRALDQGKHVLCEKPLAANQAEAQQMVDAQKRAGKVLMEAFHWRYHPLAQRLVEILQARELGPVTHISTSMCFPIPFSSNIRYRIDLAGGALMDVGAYAVHMMRTIALASGKGEPQVTSASVTRKRGMPQIDRAAHATVTFADGTTGDFRCSLWSAHLIDISLRVTGERGWLKVLNPVAPQVLHRFVVSVDGRKRREKFDKTASYTYQLRAFADTCAGKRATLTPATDSVLNHRVIDATYRAAGLELRAPATKL